MLRKRAALLLLVIAMVLAMMAPVMAAGTPTVKIEAPESVRAGETFEVRVVIENNPGLNAVQFTVGYDQKTLRCDACSTGSVLRGTLSATNADGKDGAVLAAASVNPAEDDGTLGVLKFTALADGDPKLTLRDTVFVNADSDEIEVTVTATGTTPGQESLRPDRHDRRELLHGQWLRRQFLRGQQRRADRTDDLSVICFANATSPCQGSKRQT